MIRTSARRLGALASVSMLSLMLATPAWAGSGPDGPVATALPTGGEVVAGQATIGTNGSAMTVTQSTRRGIINWQGFDIGADASVRFVQPDAASVTLNRVLGGNGSTIAGKLLANGKVYVVNPNGVLFTSTAQVDVGGLVAAAGDIADSDFLAGRDVFTISPTASVINQGSLTARGGGAVVLVGGSVSNLGAINATRGDVVLASGSKVTLDAGADGHLKVEVDGATSQALVQNGGLIAANGGQVLLTAQGAGAAVSSVVSNSGAIEARTLSNQSGRILLLADMQAGAVQAGGTLDASAPDGGDGGFVETSAAYVGFGSDLRVVTTAASGTTGNWLIDPYDISISDDPDSFLATSSSSGIITIQPSATANLNNSTLSALLDTTNVTIATGSSGTDAGTIGVYDPVNWTAATTLTLNADATTGGIYLYAPITGSNANSGLVLSAGVDWINQFSGGGITVGKLTANAVNGGSVALYMGDNHVAQLGASSASESFIFWNGDALTVTGPVTSGTGWVDLKAAGDLAINAALSDSHADSFFKLSSTGGTLTFAKDLTLSGNTAWLYLAAANGYALTGGARVTLSGTAPILDINSQDYTLIRNVTQLQAIPANAAGYYALVGDIDASVTSSWNSGAGFAPLSNFQGTFAGFGHAIDGLTINRPSTTQAGLFDFTNSATLRDFTLSNASVAGAARVGAVVGNANSTTLLNVHVTGNVGGLKEVGGISGWFSGGILTGVSSAANVTASDAEVGGLIGRAFFTNSITDSYATGSLTGSSMVGGLIGQVEDGSGLDLTRVYASGHVAGTSLTGGLVGSLGLVGGTVSGAYWDVNSTGQTTSPLGTGITNANAFTQATYAGFDFTNTWVILPGSTRPMLRNEASGVIFTPQALQLMSLNLAGSYKLGADINLTGAFTANGGYYGGIWGSAGFSPVGASGTPFTGSFDGQNHSITGLTISRSGANYVGLFGYVNGGTIANVKLAGGSVIGDDGVGALVGYLLGGSVSNAGASATINGNATSEANTGGLVGTNDGGAIADSWASGAVTGAGYQIGGLVGFNVNGATITRSYATGNVSGTSTVSGFGYVGGLVGANGYSGDGGTISQSYATGTVTGGAGPIGGFVGHNEGQITDSYAMGAVIGTGSATNIGGFVGVNYNNGTISAAYSTGRVAGSGAGGFAGYNNNGFGSITSAYWDTQTSGQSIGVSGGTTTGVTGRTTAQLQGALPPGFSSSIWGRRANLYPYFGWRYASTPVAVSGIAVTSVSGGALIGGTVTAVSNGSAIGSAATGANGYYYILADAGSIGSAGALAYLDGGATKGAAFGDVVTATGIQNLSLYGSALNYLTNDASLTATQADYLAARGSYADTDLSFITGNGLSTSTGYGMQFATSGAYLLDASVSSGGLLSFTAPSFSVSGTVTLASLGPLSIGAVSWSDASSLSLSTMAGGISLGGAISAANGTLSLSATGVISAPNAVAVNTFKLLGGTWSQTGTLPGFSAVDFQLTPTATFIRALAGDGSAGSPYQIADVYGLQGMASYGLLAQNLVLANDINASGTAAWNGLAGFLPIGINTNVFTGSFDGQGHAITGLRINRSTPYVGLFGYSSGAIRNLSLTGQVTGSSQAGGLLGFMSGGNVTSVQANVTVSGASFGQAGGLVGYQTGGTISRSSASGDVSGVGSAVGGLVGQQTGGSIDQSFAIGAVSSTLNNAGGLVGIGGGTITNSYATGNVTLRAQGGGLVGYLNGGTIINSYATGTVSGTSLLGGFVGYNGGTITGSFWNTTSSGRSIGIGGGTIAGVTGLSATGMNLLVTFAAAGWDIDDAGGTGKIWRIYDGSTAPLLRSFLTPLTATGDTVTQTYSGSALSTAGTITYSVGTPDYSRLFGTPGYVAASADAGTYTGGNLKLTGLYSNQASYDVIAVPGSFTILPATLTVNVDPATKVYDGHGWSGGSVSYSGFVNGEGTSVLGGTLVYGGNSQGATNAGFYVLSASGLSSNNYAINYNPNVLSITPTALIVRVNDATSTYAGVGYSGGNGVTYTGFVNNEDSSVLGGALAYGGTSQGAANVGFYGLTASGLTSGNYAISYVAGSLTINPARLTVTVNGAGKTYDGLAYSGGNGVSYSGFVNNENAAVLGGSLAYGGAAQGAVNAGVYGLTASGLTSGNYAISYVGGALTVTPAPLTVTATGASKTYDGLAYSGGNGVSYSGFVHNENASVLGGTLAYGGTAQGAINAGSYGLTASGLTSGNYAISYVDGALTVTPAALTVTVNGAGKTYDGLAYSGGNGVTYAGFVNNESSSVLGGTLTYGGAAQGATNAGVYGLTASGLTSGNYAIGYVAGALTVTPAALTVTVNGATKTYDGLAYSGGNGVTYSGFVHGETASVLGGMLTYGGAAQGAINAGSYGLSASGQTSPNYTIRYVAGNLVISPAALTISADSLSVPVFGALPALTYTVTGLARGDSAASVLSGALATDAKLDWPGDYAISQGSLAITSSNYLLSLFRPGTLTVTGRSDLGQPDGGFFHSLLARNQGLNGTGELLPQLVTDPGLPGGRAVAGHIEYEADFIR